MVKILTEKCIGCNQCVKHCPVGIISLCDSKATVTNHRACLNCGHCQGVCEFNAITLYDIQQPTENAKNDVAYEDLKNLIKSNRSIRKFKDTLIEKDQIENMLRTLDYTASAKNEQPVKWIVVSGREQVEKIFALSLEYLKENNLEPGLLKFIEAVSNPITVDAPHLLIAYANKNSIKPYDDCMIKMSMASLLLHSSGIGSCYLGYLADFINHSPKLKSHFDLDDSKQVFSVIGFGYSDEVYTRIPTRKKAEIKFYI